MLICMSDAILCLKSYVLVLILWLVTFSTIDVTQYNLKSMQHNTSIV